MTTKGIYIYGIVPNSYSPDMFRSLENSGVYSIPMQNLSAIVSDRENTDLDYADRESLGKLLVHHQRTIENLMEKGFHMLIPMRLGTIVSSRREVSKILANGHDLIIDTLKAIEYMVEIDIAVSWTDFSNTIKELAAHPDIIAMKADIMNESASLSQANQAKMGLLVQEKLKEKNNQIELKILEALSAFNADVKTHEVMDDQMITNSAFLLSRKQQEKFERVVDQLDEEYNGSLNFKLVGPLPCYSFYTLEVKDLNPEHVVQAKNELGLKEVTSEPEIKKAYLEKAKLFHPDVQRENGKEEMFNKIKKAYHTLLEYSAAARQSSKDTLISLAKERVIENLTLIQIRE